MSQAKFSVDGKRLSFGVESPLVRSVIEARLKAVGIFGDISLSGEILKIPTNQLGVFVRAFLSSDRAESLRRKLKGVTDDEGLVNALNKFGVDVGADLVKEVAKKAAEHGLSGLFGWIAGAGGAGGVGEMADAVSQYFDQG